MRIFRNTIDFEQAARAIFPHTIEFPVKVYL